MMECMYKDQRERSLAVSGSWKKLPLAKEPDGMQGQSGDNEVSLGGS